MTEISNLHAVIWGIISTAVIAVVAYHVGRMSNNATRKQFLTTMLVWLDECSAYYKRVKMRKARETEFVWLVKRYGELDELLRAYAYTLKFDFVKRSREVLGVVPKHIDNVLKSGEYMAQDEYMTLLEEHTEETKTMIAKTYPKEYLRYILKKEMLEANNCVV